MPDVYNFVLRSSTPPPEATTAAVKKEFCLYPYEHTESENIQYLFNQCERKNRNFMKSLLKLRHNNFNREHTLFKIDTCKINESVCWCLASSLGTSSFVMLFSFFLSSAAAIFLNQLFHFSLCN